MHILTFPVGQLQANCYFATCEQTKKTILIDPGNDAPFLTEELQRHSCQPEMIIATHGHFDHVLGITHLQLALNLPFYIHEDEIMLLENASQNARYWTGLEENTPTPLIDKFLTDNERISWGEESLQVIHTPGHTPGSVCFYNKKNCVLFSGDTLFKGSIGRSDFSYSDPQQLRESLIKILALPEETIVYPGHGEKTTIRAEREALGIWTPESKRG